METIPNIISHKVTSWTKGYFDIHITHAEATKKHALEILLERLHVHRDEVVAVGDSNNDLPLLEMAGLKVAMGNATEDLKKVADHIAPSVDQDGLTEVIKKFILRTES